MAYRIDPAMPSTSPVLLGARRIVKQRYPAISVSSDETGFLGMWNRIAELVHHVRRSSGPKRCLDCPLCWPSLPRSIYVGVTLKAALSSRLSLLLLLLSIAALASAQSPTLRLGAAWYPEQWPEAQWDHDLQLMRDAHMNVVRVGEFAW